MRKNKYAKYAQRTPICLEEMAVPHIFKTVFSSPFCGGLAFPK